MRAVHVLFLMVAICILKGEAERSSGKLRFLSSYCREVQRNNPSLAAQLPSSICPYQSTSIKYTIRNRLSYPFFDETVGLERFERDPFIRYMEMAANESKTFQFAAKYYTGLGNFITMINDLVAINCTTWAFLLSPDILISTGVSSYYPNDGDHIIFNYTSYC